MFKKIFTNKLVQWVEYVKYDKWDQWYEYDKLVQWVKYDLWGKHGKKVLGVLFLLVLLVAVGYLFDATRVKAAWYSGTWGYRKIISVDHNKVAGASNLTDFPILFSITDPDLRHTSFGGKVGKTDGTDILFTSSDGTTKLNHEIEKYASTTGEVVIWVKVPTLNTSANTDLYVYYGNSGAADQQDATNVWDSNFKGVYHFGNGTTLSTEDSTSNNNDLTNSSSVATTTAKIGGAADINGTSYLRTPAFAATSNLSFSTWVNKKVNDNYGMMISSIIAAPYSEHELRWDGTNRYAQVVWNYSNSGWQLPQWNFALNLYEYYHYYVTYNGSVVKLYVNGIERDSKSGASDGSPVQFDLGRRYGGGFNMRGAIDEVRFSNTTRSADWIATEFNNQSDPTRFYSYGLEEVLSKTASNVALDSSVTHGSTWYSSSWIYRKAITIDRTKVATTTSFSNFPVLISVTNPEFKHTAHGGKVGKTDGTDILFTSSDGTTKLDHEIEKYASTTGEVVAWVEVPTLSGQTNTGLYMYYGNSGAADQQNATGVWDSNFKSVWHMDENPAGGAPQISDSTSNARNATSNGTMTSGDSIIGKIGNALDFDGSNDYLSTGVTYNDSAFTYSLWSYATRNTGGNMYQIGEGSASGRDIGVSISDVKYQVYEPVATGILAGTFAQNTWHHLVFTHNGTTGTLYLNGVQVDSGNFTPATGGNLTIASYVGGFYWQGYIDEVRVSNTARSSYWIQTEYNNQSSPSTFYTFESGTDVVASWYNASWGYRKKITIDKTQVATTSALTNFPILFSVTDPDLRHTGSGGKMGNSDATDMLFTLGDGTTKLDHEIEKYTSTTGEVVAWVEVPNLPGTTDTPLYVYFGNSGVADQQNATGVWDSKFGAVWHLKETPTANIVDSTSNPNDGSPTSMVSGDQVTGKINGAISFNSGGNGYYTIASDASINLSTSFSVSGWYNMSTDANYRQFYTSGTQTNYWFLQKDSSDRLLFTESGVADYTSTGVIANGSWRHFSVVKNGDGSSNLSIYIDGVLDSTHSVGTVAAPSGNKTFGFSGGAGPIIDEMRIANVARGSDWVKTEFNNQSNPGGFYGYGGLEKYGERADMGGASTPAVKVRGGVKFR